MPSTLHSLGARLRAYSVILIGIGLIGGALGFAISRGSDTTELLMEVSVPVLVGVGLAGYGGRLAERDYRTERIGTIALFSLATGFVITTIALWGLVLNRYQLTDTENVAQIGMLSMSIGCGVGGVVGHFYTELRETHQETDRLWRAIASSMDGVAIIEDGSHVYTNAAYASLYGFPNSSAIEGHSLTALYTNESLQSIEDEVIPTLEERDYWRGQLTGKRYDEATFPKEVTASKIDNGYVVVVRDVSAQQEREQRIQVLNRVLRHNLRNTFTVIQGHVNLIAERAPELEDVHVGPIREEIDDLVETADKARGVERTLERRGQYAPVDPSTAVRKSVDRAAAAYPEATIVSHVEETGLPPVDASIVDALNELVDNAVQHAEIPNPSVEVSVQEVTASERRRIEFAVIDDGPGIPEADRHAVLEGEETPLDHGSGLGLWVVNWIVRNAGGELDFSEVPGGGTAVKITMVDDTTPCDDEAYTEMLEAGDLVEETVPA